MDPKDRTLESMNMFGKRDPTQLLNPSTKRAKIDTTLDSDDIDLENPDETPDIEIIEQEESPVEMDHQQRLRWLLKKARSI
jgi:hypothetical protein